MSDHLRDNREQKLRRLLELGISVYPDSFDVSVSLAEAQDLLDEEPVSVAGRIVGFRPHGKLIFADLQDIEGKLQVAFTAKLPGNIFKFVSELLNLGDFIGVKGKMATSHSNERTVAVEDAVFLCKSLLPLPSKHEGATDEELRQRKRHLDLIANEESRHAFLMRSRIISFIRRYLDDRGFLEVETPTLQKEACGASARPFVTHHNALDMDLYLRISPETYLKRLIVGGFTKVYEIGKNFRNEGTGSPQHLQEFTMLEWYVAYWNYKRNLTFIREMLQEIIGKFCGGLKIEYQGRTLDFSGEWEQCKYSDLVLEETGIDLSEIETLEQLRSEIQRKGLDLDCEKYMSLGSLMDALYKKTVRPKLVQPMFLMEHPAELVPLARRNDDNPRVLDMFQVVVNGWEIVKAYSELVDPEEQKARLLEQAGDDEAMMLELDYIECMEYGMPPNSGLGLGIDRLVALLTNQRNLRGVTLFPMMRPEQPDE